MKIKKILNNNAIISENNQTEEIIITGKGIAFGKKAGDLIDRDKIEKTFILKHNETSEKFKILLEDIPVDYVSISYDIIEYAKNILNVQFNDFIYQEVRKKYTKAYQCAEKIENYFLKTYKRKLSEEEKTYLAIHIQRITQK